MTPEPFTLHVPDEVLDDLQTRLERTRCQYADPRSRPSSAALASHAASQTSAVSSDAPVPMSRLRVPAR
jgi:hypothetical protein